MKNSQIELLKSILKDLDLKEYPDVTPNICNVMIFDEYRGQGFGKKLVEYAKR